MLAQRHRKVKTVAVNPDVLRWARATSGLDLDTAAQKLGIRATRSGTASGRLEKLEFGLEQPSRNLLAKMAAQYHRPLLTFYQEAAPAIEARGEDFRRLPKGESQIDYARADALIRDIKARQAIVSAALDDADEASPLAFVGSMRLTEGVSAVSAAVQKLITFSLHEYRGRTSGSDSFSYLRSKVEASGVFVLLIGDLGSHHTRIGLETFRGLALSDSVAPFIVINDQDSRAAWSFSLLHEYVHICLGQSGVSGNDLGIASDEQFCNDVASEILLPRADLQELRVDSALPLAVQANLISEFASERRISRSMVAYRLFRENRIGRTVWTNLRSEFRAQWQSHLVGQQNVKKPDGGGPSYYTVKRHRVGGRLLRFVDRMTSNGALSATKAGKVLGVKPRNVFSLLAESRA